jgi:hypothetical protein
MEDHRHKIFSICRLLLMLAHPQQRRGPASPDTGGAANGLLVTEGRQPFLFLCRAAPAGLPILPNLNGFAAPKQSPGARLEA